MINLLFLGNSEKAVFINVDHVVAIDITLNGIIIHTSVEYYQVDLIGNIKEGHYKPLDDQTIGYLNKLIDLTESVIQPV